MDYNKKFYVQSTLVKIFLKYCNPHFPLIFEILDLDEKSTYRLRSFLFLTYYQ